MTPASPVRVIDRTTNWLVEGTDCDDQLATVTPLSAEQCNGFDDDCDGLVDETLTRAWYPDLDLDGYGAGAALQSCLAVPGYSTLSNDCDDTNPAVTPGAMVCEPVVTSGNELKICGADGGFSLARCSGQAVCLPQPNGTGVCF
ncbi:putative metal-binding motif-containing protein [Bosea sp. (in: a-proteobacteria)]|uniref:putative metal-binding motif-containing protein n=1 Tax=Bosea sp. (in: a-proteobacteria) TaxID=1871050 RepID=UPI002732BCA0|nr:putative metal-binding motif-containing protein [Bosea sp. (in: a-proteobacteria)]MDP3410122.1 putative metal-binding motif-containing protein [Bosea sp. (in: a-proteobacteria)]